MKTYKEYIEKNDLLFESEWNYNIPKTRMFETDKNNQIKAKEVLNAVLKKGNPYYDAMEELKQKYNKGEKIETTEKEIQDILQSISTIATIAQKKTIANVYKIITPYEAQKILNSINISIENIHNNNLVKLGTNIINTKRKSFELSKKEKEEKDNKNSEEDLRTNEIDFKKSEKENSKDEEEQNKYDEKIIQDLRQEPVENDKIDDEEKDLYNPYDKNNSKKLDINKEKENENSPFYIYNKAQEMISNTISSLEDMIKNEDDPNRKGVLQKALLSFKKEANNSLYKIDKQQKKFSIYPTTSSRLDATTEAKKHYHRIKYLVSKAEYNANAINRKNILQRAGMRLTDTGNALKKKIEKIDYKTKPLQNTIARGASTLKDKITSASKSAKDALQRANNVIKSSSTAQAIKDTTKKVLSNIDTKVAEKLKTIGNEKTQGQNVNNNQNNTSTIKNTINTQNDIEKNSEANKTINNQEIKKAQELVINKLKNIDDKNKKKKNLILKQ